MSALSHAGRAVAVRLGYQPPIEGARARARELHSEGLTLGAIAERVRSSRSTVCRWIKETL